MVDVDVFDPRSGWRHDEGVWYVRWELSKIHHYFIVDNFLVTVRFHSLHIDRYGPTVSVWQPVAPDCARRRISNPDAIELRCSDTRS